MPRTLHAFEDPIFKLALAAVGFAVRPDASTPAADSPRIDSGEGAPTLTRPKNSIYIRTDAGDAGTWLYRNTDGAATWEAGTDTEVAELLAAANAWTGANTFQNLLLGAATELTIATGAVAKTRSYHTIDTEADAGSDDLDSITGGAAGEVLLVRLAAAARNVVLKHAVGADKIACPGSAHITLDVATDWALLVHNGSQWTVVAASTLATAAGIQNRPAGASTAALGTNSGNAAALPAGTAPVYPTTAADDTVGVRVHASDEVDGRMIFIGNGVGNKILKVYPPTGSTVNGLSADAAFSSVSGKGVIFYCLNAAAHTWLAW